MNQKPGEAKPSGVVATKPEAPADPTCSMQVDSYVKRRKLFKTLWVSPLLLRNQKTTVAAVQTPKVIKTLRIEDHRMIQQREYSRELHQACKKLLRSYHNINKSTKGLQSIKQTPTTRKRKICIKKSNNYIPKSKSMTGTPGKAKNYRKNDNFSNKKNAKPCYRDAIIQASVLRIDKSTVYEDFDLLNIEFGNGNAPNVQNKGKRNKKKRCRKKKKSI